MKKWTLHVEFDGRDDGMTQCDFVLNTYQDVVDMMSKLKCQPVREAEIYREDD